MTYCYKVFCLLCLFATSCQSGFLHEQLADEEVGVFVKEIRATDGLELMGYGGGFLDRVNSISLTFYSPVQPTVDEARWMFFSVADRFLDRVNCSEALRPHLANYPFTIFNNLDLMIVFKASQDRVSAVSMGKIITGIPRELVMFTTRNPATQQLEMMHEELFQDSLALYEQQKAMAEAIPCGP